MAANSSRALTLALAADIDGLQKGLKKADNEIQTFGGKVNEFGKKAALAFAAAAAAAGAYATKLAVDGVKAAIEDEAAQLRLASALKTATGATDAQIKATEEYISKTSLAVGVSDDDLRPALQRLSVATGDVKKSQDLLNLAIDISKGTGKDLASVTEALSRAYTGQDTQLAKLGIGITAAQAKQLDFRGEVEKLSDLYGGAAARNAETFQGRIDRLKIGFQEAKEAVGVALLPIIEKLIGYIFEYGAPIVEKFQEGWEKVQGAIDRNKENFQEFIAILQNYVLPIIGTVFSKFFDLASSVTAKIIDVFGSIVGAITPIVNFIIDAINTTIRAYNFVTKSNVGLLNKIGGVGGGGGSFSENSGGGVSAGGGFAGLGGGGGFNAGGGFGGIGGAGGGGGGGSAAEVAVIGSVQKLNSELDKIITGFEELDFAIETNQLTNKQATKQFNKLLDQFAALEKVANQITSPAAVIGNVGYTVPGSYTSMTGRDAPINITVNGAVDAESTARQMVDLIQQSQARGGGAILLPYQ
jgi:hypothetical protein